jgi:hypothetical protein
MESTIQRMSKEARSLIQSKETTTLSLLYKISMLNAKSITGHKSNKCRLPMQSLNIGNPNKQNKNIWKRKSKVQSNKDDEYIAPEIDEVNNRRMVGKDFNNEYKNQMFAYKVNQAQERRVPKEEYDTIVVLDDVLQINNPLANERKMEKENSKEEYEEVYVTQNSDDDDESSIVEKPEELSDDDLRSFPMLFL